MDSRKSKRLIPKIGFILPVVQGQIIMENENAFKKIVSLTLKKSIINTGWGLTKNKANANYIVEIDIKKFTWEKGVLYGNRIIKSRICILNNRNNIIIKKEIEKHTPIVFATYTKGGVNIAGIPLKELYQELIKFFSSPEFVNAVEHKSVVFDNSSNSKPLSN